jgi:hypothetical protein
MTMTRYNKAFFAYEYGWKTPGVAPDTHFVYRHAAGTCGPRRDASASGARACLDNRRGPCYNASPDQSVEEEL